MKLQRTHPAVLGAAFFASALVAAACSSNGTTTGISDGDAGAAGPDVDNGASCAADPMVDPGLSSAVAVALPYTRAGKAGVLSFVLVDPMTPNPPSESANTWTLKVLDAKGNPVTDATISFPRTPVGGNPWMPKMRHPAAVNAQATNNGDGTYAIGSLYFTMNGIWQLVVQAQSGSVADTATFTFCVP